jgi:hypothetical protein
LISDPSKAKEDEEGGDVGGSIEELILSFLVFEWQLSILTISVFAILLFTAFSIKRKSDKCNYDICNKEL